MSTGPRRNQSWGKRKEQDGWDAKSRGMDSMETGIMDKKILWAELWKVEPHQVQFLIQSAYDVLPSPTNSSLGA